MTYLKKSTLTLERGGVVRSVKIRGCLLFPASVVLLYQAGCGAAPPPAMRGTAAGASGLEADLRFFVRSWSTI